MMSDFWQFLVHTDEYLSVLAGKNMELTYLLLFLIVFSESGILLFSFMPGDGLLLAAGIVAATGVLNIWVVLFLLLTAAIAGYAVNYLTGRYFGNWIVSSGRWFIRKEHLDKTHKFFERHGGKALILGRFFPVVRTFAPFLAGMGKMEIKTFLKDTVIGAVLWICFGVLIGYFSHNIPFVQQNFLLLYLLLFALTLVPLVWGSVWVFLKKKKEDLFW